MGGADGNNGGEEGAEVPEPSVSSAKISSVFSSVIFGSCVLFSLYSKFIFPK